MLDDASSETMETTLLDLLEAIHEVTSDDDEAFAVLESMLERGRITVVAAQPARAA